MKRFIGFGSIDQFRTIIKNVQRTAQFVSYDEETKEVTVNRDAKMPTIEFDVSEKNHGSNAGFSYNELDKEWFQSRKNIITVEKDNAGCSFMMSSKKDIWIKMIENLAKENNINLKEKGIVVFSEISGGNIQKNACFSGIEKRFTIFQYAKVYNIEPVIDEKGEEESNYWIETKVDNQWIKDNENLIHNVMDLNSFKFTIDFNEPLMYQNQMIKMVEDIEKNSIMGEKLGIKGNIGEGFVFQAVYKGGIIRFKVKGKEHSKGSGSVKTLKPVDEEFENKKRTFVNDIAATEGRLNQAFTEIVHTVHNGDENLMEMKDMGDFLRLVVNDVIKEELDRMVEQGLEPKVINSMISKVAREFFKSELDRIAGMGDTKKDCKNCPFCKNKAKNESEFL